MRQRLTALFLKVKGMFAGSVNLRYGAAVLCGAMVTLLFSPFEYILFLFPALSGLFLLVEMAESRRQSFMTGWWFGLGMYVSGLYWIANAMLVDAEQFGWMIPFVVVGMNGVLAIYSGLLGLVMWWIRSAPMKWKWLAFAVAWGALEGLRSVLFTGFPWNLLGYATVFSESLMQLATDMPIIGLSVALVLVGTLPVLLAQMKRKQAVAGVLVALMALFLAHGYGEGKIADTELVAMKAGKPSPYRYQKEPVYMLLQGNVEQKVKSDPASRERQLRTYLKMMDEVRQARFNALVDADPIERNRSLVFVWPETAFPYLVMNDSHWMDFLPTTLHENEAMVAGVMRGEKDEAGQARYYNSMMIVQRGKPIRFYDKKHLVPFGEYVPFRKILPIEKLVPGMADFSMGANGNKVEAKAGDIVPNFLALICYEAIFSDMISLDESEYAKLIINVTNDGWFGDSIGPYQHLMMARFRAVEHGLPMLRVANTGVSATIDSHGRIVDIVPLSQKGMISWFLFR